MKKYIELSVIPASILREATTIAIPLAWNATESAPVLPLLGCVLGFPTFTDTKESEWADLKSLFKLNTLPPTHAHTGLQIVLPITYV